MTINDLPDFPLEATNLFSKLFRQEGIQHFHQAIYYLENFHSERSSDLHNLQTVLTEKKGSITQKNALIAAIAEENGHEEIELIGGIFMLNETTHPELTDFFTQQPFAAFPEMYCYIRFKGKRYDFSGNSTRFLQITPRIVREQRIEPHQSGDWKETIHKDYLKRWLGRNEQVTYTPEKLWEIREEITLD